MGANKEYYRELGLEENATQEEITKTYKKESSKWHPDNYKGTRLETYAEEKMKKINNAYDILSKLGEKPTKKDEKDRIIEIEKGKLENYDSIIIFLRGINKATGIFKDAFTKEGDLITACPNTKFIFLKFPQEIENKRAIGGTLGHPIVCKWYEMEISKSKSPPPSVQTFEKYQEWYNKLEIDGDQLMGYAFLDDSGNFQRISGIVNNEITLNPQLKNRRIIIAGFSQGASLALSYAVHKNFFSDTVVTLGGVISLNGFLPLADDELSLSALNPKSKVKSDLPAKSRVIPFLLCNTNDDHLVPYWTGEMSSKILRDKLGYQKIEFLDGQPTETERKTKVIEFLTTIFQRPLDAPITEEETPTHITATGKFMGGYSPTINEESNERYFLFSSYCSSTNQKYKLEISIWHPFFAGKAPHYEFDGTSQCNTTYKVTWPYEKREQRLFKLADADSIQIEIADGETKKSKEPKKPKKIEPKNGIDLIDDEEWWKENKKKVIGHFLKTEQYSELDEDKWNEYPLRMQEKIELDLARWTSFRKSMQEIKKIYCLLFKNQNFESEVTWLDAKLFGDYKEEEQTMEIQSNPIFDPDAPLLCVTPLVIFKKDGTEIGRCKAKMIAREGLILSDSDSEPDDDDDDDDDLSLSSDSDENQKEFKSISSCSVEVLLASTQTSLERIAFVSAIKIITNTESMNYESAFISKIIKVESSQVSDEWENEYVSLINKLTEDNSREPWITINISEDGYFKKTNSYPEWELGGKFSIREGRLEETEEQVKEKEAQAERERERERLRLEQEKQEREAEEKKKEEELARQKAEQERLEREKQEQKEREDQAKKEEEEERRKNLILSQGEREIINLIEEVLGEKLSEKEWREMSDERKLEIINL